MKKLLIFISSVVLFTSCYTTWTTVGNYKQLESQGLSSYKYDQAKQFYLFGGLIPLGHNHANVPDEPCEIKEKFKFTDFLISTVTCEIFTCRTIQVYALKGYSPAPSKQQEEQIIAKEEVAPKATKVKEETAVIESTPKQEEFDDIEEIEFATAEKNTGSESASTNSDSKVTVIEQVEEPIEEVEAPAVEEKTTEIVVEEKIAEPEPVKKETGDVITEQGAILAPFSVGSTKKVYFSKGNLQYQASSKTWRFAEQQYDMIGADNSKISPSNSSWIDLFGWGTSGWDNKNTFYMPYETESASATYGYGYGPTDGQTYEYGLRGIYAEADWGVANVISEAGDTAGMWRTLTRNEWGYLLLKRPNAVNLYSLAIVNGVKGLVILPDDWSYPTNVKFIERTSFELNTYNSEQWEIMESYGAVFLPTAGCRYGTTVGNLGSTGSYWTASSAGGENAWYFVFNKGKIDISSDFSRALGRSVRLVQDIK
ncbi:MAG: hypothetical protein MJ198_00540 [Bacteroidales bacterium]|nr:hypothetical protein [Bacteroidales bacterium]